MTLACPTINAADHDSKTELVVTDFTPATPDLGWYVVNDTVMGGRSEGGFESHHDGLHFTGTTNTNGGGFSSVRTKPMQLDLSKYTGVRLAVQGDGRRYTWRLATNARRRGRPVSYWADFETPDGTWSTIDIPFSSFIPRFRGTQLEGPELDPAQISGMGLMIYDEQDGPFDLRLASVRAYASDEAFELTQFRWDKRLLVLSAESGENQSLKEQLRSVALTRQESALRDLVLVTLLDRGESAAEGRELTAAEVAAVRATLGIPNSDFALRLIGKDGSVKLARDTIMPMADIHALIDTMPMRKAETADRH